MIDKDIVTLVLQNLYSNEEFSRAAMPHIKEEYFLDNDEKIIFNTIHGYVEKYNQLPSRDVILIELDQTKGVMGHTIDYFREVFTDDKPTHDKDWLLEKTEQFCQDTALHIALRDSVNIADDDDSNLSKTAIPDILKEALSVSFDNAIGHDYMNGLDDRLDFYHEDQHKIGFSLDIFNKITNGGMPNKSVMILLGGTGTGKSLFLTHLSTDFMVAGKNVLYITLEMSEERIEERIDANLLDIPIGELLGVERKKYKKIANDKIKESFGNIVTKEYPTAGAHVGHFRFLLNELRLKKDFKPDVIMVDYLNICTSSRVKQSSNANSYTIVKSIAEELRGLAIEFDVPIITATQTNRTGYRSSDLELTDISESFGSAATADVVLGLIATDELDELGQIGVKVVKNRYGANGDLYKLNIDHEKMRLYDVNTQVQIDTSASKPNFNRTDLGNSVSMDDDPLPEPMKFMLHNKDGVLQDGNEVLNQAGDEPIVIPQSKKDKFAGFKI